MLYPLIFTIGIAGMIAVFMHRYIVVGRGIVAEARTMSQSRWSLQNIKSAVTSVVTDVTEGFPKYTTTSIFQRAQKGIKNPRMLLRRADAFYDSGDMETAERLYIQVLSIDPKSIDAMLRLGALYIEKSAYGKAEAFLKHALENHPGNEQLRELLTSLAAGDETPNS